MSSGRSRRSSRPSTGQTVTPVLSAEYLNKHSSKNDLVKRMRHVVRDLCDESVEPDSPDYPGLAGLAAVLVEDRYLKHKDKEVRLHTVLACVEIFYMYAPEPPWDETEILKIFPQIIQQLANLTTCTSPSQPNFDQYFSLLEKLSTVKIGVILVEMTKTLESEHLHQSDHDDLNDDDDVQMDDDERMASRSRTRARPEGPTSEEALEVLRELIEVLFHCVHIDHSSEITLHASAAISACVEEFDGGVPVPILDEILKCIGAGPVVPATNPDFVRISGKIAAMKRNKSKNKKKGTEEDLKLPPRYISQTNPAYVVAEKVIRKTVDRISTPIANLLNGLLNGDPLVIKHSDISCDIPTEVETTKGKGSVVEAMDTENDGSDSEADVWTIVYELHKVSPQILTTVIGTVAADLKHVDEDKRLKVTRLLGRLFHSKSSDIGVNFHRCYREWIRRSMDRSVKVREVMLRHLLEVLRNKSNSLNLCEEASTALSVMTKQDPSLDIRLSCIHGICELVHNGQSVTATPFISGNLLQAVGDRVSSKIKKERLDSITGLAKIYNKHYMLPKVQSVERGGDDCDLDVILDAIHDSCDLSIYDENLASKQRQKQGRGKRKHSTSTPTSISSAIDDSYRFIPKLVFESVCFKDTADPVLRNRVWTLVDDVILGTESYAKDSSDKKQLKRTMSPTSRAVGLTMIVNYLQSLSEDSNVAGKKSDVYRWMESLFLTRVNLQRTLRSYLDAKAKAERYPSGSSERTEANSIALQLLESVAKLTAPPSACSSPGQTEDLDNILRKFHSARDKHIFRLLSSISTSSHSSTARIRALDDLPKRTKSLGSSTSAWVRTLARRSAMGYFINAEIIEHCILLAQESFNEGDFAVCRSFLESAKTTLNIFPSMSGKGFDYLVELFSECQSTKSTEDRKEIKQYAITTTLSGMLARTASARGSPSKGKSDKSSVDSSISDDVQSQLLSLCTKDGTVEQARNAVRTLASLHENDSDKLVKVFQPLLDTMTSSSRLSIGTGGKVNKKIVNVLETLTAIVECVPSLFMPADKKRGKGAKAIRFALETCLLGRGDRLSSQSHENLEIPSDHEDDMKSNSRKSTSKKKPGRKSSENGDILSLSCQRTCAAISFLVAHIRATICSDRNRDIKEAILTPSKEHISAVFGLLQGILEEGGKPPSSADRQECQSREARAALRRCATISIMRLCDGNLQLEKEYFTPSVWHILGRSFVDTDVTVRESAMNELSLMLTGEGIYNRTIPSLRFLAYITLCPDSDMSNFNFSGRHAANVGTRGRSTKEAALKCTSKLRRTCDTTLLRCRATSRNAEKNFERKYKAMLMPEYAVPFAFHLLALQLDTPSCGLDRKNTESSESYKLLRKRLTWLFDPLVKSLGDSADNISFLLRQSELLGQRYAPINVKTTEDPHLSDDESNTSSNSSHKDVLRSRLAVVCSTAREILLKFVKKDVNLTPYPGGIQFPASLFEATKSGTPTRTAGVNNDGPKSISTTNKDDDQTVLDSGVKSVRFGDLSPQGSQRDLGALKLSPIPLSESPESRSTSNSVDSTIETESTDAISTPATKDSTPSKKRRQRAQAEPNFSEEKKRRRSPRLLK